MCGFHLKMKCLSWVWLFGCHNWNILKYKYIYIYIFRWFEIDGNNVNLCDYNSLKKISFTHICTVLHFFGYLCLSVWTGTSDNHGTLSEVKSRRAHFIAQRCFKVRKLLAVVGISRYSRFQVQKRKSGIVLHSVSITVLLSVWVSLSLCEFLFLCCAGTPGR